MEVKGKVVGWEAYDPKAVTEALSMLCIAIDEDVRSGFRIMARPHRVVRVRHDLILAWEWDPDLTKTYMAQIEAGEEPEPVVLERHLYDHKHPRLSLYVVLKGHHRVMAFRKLGEKRVPSLVTKICQSGASRFVLHAGSMVRIHDMERIGVTPEVYEALKALGMREA